MSARLTRNVAPGVHRLQHAYVNCYILEEEGALTIVDAAHPKTWPYLKNAITALGYEPTDVRALILTHAHFDHLGFALRARQEWGIPVYAHRADHAIAEHPYQYAHENPRLIYPIRHPAALPALLGMVGAGALQVKGLTGILDVHAGITLDVPGHPEVVFTPGHTYGHCAYFLRSASTLLSGDALVTFNPYTGAKGPQIVSGAATADSSRALASLDKLAATGAEIVLPGHGPSWRTSVESAVARALEAGPS
ncbi:MBL fold metallo-hydrolase [Glaciihabitans sp. dw_435]|uniref:MBL fold metallo-hydrolase n=1 Tax=Glaciihabitans sp. dw_435 TaxID=2720081 RepID=UPI001BD65E5C|nr:MBL fold metallo-hydrolase [Glaciihabitans sp. dw_435]